MAGPIVHYEVLKKVAEYTNLPIKCNLYQAIQYDLDMASHGYDYVTGEGPLLDWILNLSTNNLLKSHKYNYIGIRSLTHLLTDFFTLGQISKTLWGYKDNLLDAAAELIPNKTIHCNITTNLQITKLKNNLLVSARSIHKDNNLIESKGLIRYILSKEFKETVRLGIYYAVNYSKLIINQS